MSRELLDQERDGVSLMFGLLLVLIAGVFLVDDLTGLDVDGRWVAPLVLIAVGAVGLVSTLRPAVRRAAQEDSAAP